MLFKGFLFYFVVGIMIGLIFLRKDEMKHFPMFVLTWPLFLRDLIITLYKLYKSKNNR